MEILIVTLSLILPMALMCFYFRVVYEKVNPYSEKKLNKVFIKCCKKNKKFLNVNNFYNYKELISLICFSPYYEELKILILLFFVQEETFSNEIVEKEKINLNILQKQIERVGLK